MYGTLKKGRVTWRWQKAMLLESLLMQIGQIISYQFVSLGKMTDFIKKGDDPGCMGKAKGQYGRALMLLRLLTREKND